MDPAIKAKMHSKIKTVMKERTGPSFQERVEASASKMRKEAKMIEDSQAQVIQAAVARAKARPMESAPRTKEEVPPSIEQWGKEHAHTRRENEKRYAQVHAERKHRQDTREPLFKLSEVNAAFAMQAQRMKEHKKQMQDDEQRRWDHLQALQERVIHRPLLLEDPTAIPEAHEEAQAKDPNERDPNWKAKFQVKMNRRIKQTIKERSGPSFEERVADRAKKLRKETKVQEDVQAKIIETAVSKAKARPSESPFRPKEEEPPSVADFAKEHKETRKENEERYAQLDAERKHRMNTREPLFRVSEVEAAFEEQRKRQVAYRRALTKDEQDRWAMLNSMQERVVDRPLLVESYERPVHVKSVPELRSIPNHTKPLKMDLNIKKCISNKAFKESAWGKEVESLHTRMDQRQKLHEIEYPPKVYEPKPPPKRILNSFDQRIADQINHPWFKNSSWATEVGAIKQRQDDRPKLHEISYPPKDHWN